MKTLKLVSVIALLSLQPGAGLAGGPPTAVTDEKPSVGGHSLDEKPGKIRRHHIKRLEDRVNVDSALLHQTCRYESEISTAPPAKRVVLSFDDGPEPGQGPCHRRPALFSALSLEAINGSLKRRGAEGY